MGIEDGKEEGTKKLNGGEQGSKRQVEEFDGLNVDFHFEGGELGAAKQENHAKGGEVEEEDEERGGEDGRADERQSDVHPHAQGVRAEGACHLFEFGVEAGEGGANDADDDGGVVENVSEQDGKERMNDEGGRSGSW